MSSDTPRVTMSGRLPLRRSLSLGVLWRVFMRSLFLQASWNPQGMQTLGLAYALSPALTELYPEIPQTGKGVVLEDRVRSNNCFLTAAYSRNKHLPWSASGGREGSANRIEVIRANGSREHHAVVGGLVVSQILTLYLTPVIYLYMNRLQERLAPARKHVGAALAAKSQQGG